MSRIEPRPTRLRSLADLHPDGIVGATIEGEITFINDHAARLLGTNVEVATRGRIDDVLRLQDQDGRNWWQVNRPDQSLSTRTGIPEQSWLNTDGEEVLTTARLVRDLPLSPVVGIAIGIRSGRGRARLDRERSDLVATVAHELRSPLTGVKGFVQALLNRWDKLNDDQRKLMLETVNADADRLVRLIAELLDVARIDTGRLPLYPRGSDAVALAQRVVNSVGAGTSRTIELSASDGLPEIFADPDKFTQVVTNLVENAVRHGQGLVLVSLSELPATQHLRGRAHLRGRRGRRNPQGDAQPHLHEVLEARGQRRLRPRHVHRRRAHPRPWRLRRGDRRAQGRRPRRGRLAVRGPAPRVNYSVAASVAPRPIIITPPVAPMASRRCGLRANQSRARLAASAHTESDATAMTAKRAPRKAICAPT